ncbi:MAG TPA: aminopeptidase [Porphyromonadaceae bacterium]|nr:aminopeptidase [Porphyromonadaceae bacterium]HBL34801.1 aminopeptidase [Porphyromonadaceae bacterium]HBX20532.1 aminopeptidase [Porphyromonadaceae bacterium]HCM22094.1 aminopeptidase [Porphyromonadaceae bacterium]
MKKFYFIFVALTISLTVAAQVKTNAYTFQVIKENAITPIKNQANSGTCWSFSGVGLLESELLRTGKGTYDLSEMYIVRRNYEDKATKYARLHGSLNFSAGGSFADVIETIDEYGLIPDVAYNGLNYGSEQHNHNEMDKVLKGYMDGIVNAKSLSPVWYEGFSAILDTYLGKVPETFTYEGKQYTPQSFAEHLGLKSDQFVSLSSFTHHPFYTTFAIEVPDNWRWAKSYNLPIDEMIEAIDHAIMQGYTVAWASDVSEIGFSRTGMAIIPDEKAAENAGSDQAHWLGLSPRERDEALRGRIGKELLAEKQISQEMRQESFNNYQTTDDHGMLIYGIAKDQNGNKYYLVKNSWGKAGNNDGIWYASEAFVRYKTLNVVVNKNSLPKGIARKLKL